MRLALSLGLIVSGLLLVITSLLPTAFFSVIEFTTPQKILIDPSAVSFNASSWFTKTPNLPSPVSESLTHFSLTYPEIDLQAVPVLINGTDLKQGAIHYPGTMLPGDYGNAVVFGHSALPQFFKKNSPLTLFNPLLKAKIGDEIIINFDGIIYRYVVRKTTEVEPTQIEVMFQDFSRKELTLITCTPLGTYWRRFVVRAELVN